MNSDERLAQLASRGDKRALEEIYERYHQDLYRFCLAMVGYPHDAQDTLQNTMVKVLRSLPGEKRKIKLKPWLYRIARNEAIETLRRRRPGVELEPHQIPVVGVSETAETRERLRALLGDLEQLPERQRAALVMRELSGLDFEQIGAALGSSPGAARQTLYEARLSLRQLEAGREMRCADVMRELSDADGRVTRRREIRAHLRSCADCQAFRDQIGKRHEDLAGLAPLPAATAAGLLHGLLGGKAGGAIGGGANSLAVTAGGGAGKAVATSVIVKSAATVAVAVVAGISADRSGLIDLPLPGKAEHAAVDGSDAADGSSKAGRSAAAVAALRRSRAAAKRISGKDRSGGGNRSKRRERSATAGGVGHGDGASKTAAGSNPPGGGYGRSASTHGGRPEGRPEAAADGQRTASEHKSPHAVAPPEKSAGSGQKGSTEAAASPPAGNAPPVEAPTPPPATSPPEAPTPPAQSEGASARDGAPPTVER